MTAKRKAVKAINGIPLTVFNALRGKNDWVTLDELVAAVYGTAPPSSAKAIISMAVRRLRSDGGCQISCAARARGPYRYKLLSAPPPPPPPPPPKAAVVKEFRRIGTGWW